PDVSTQQFQRGDRHARAHLQRADKSSDRDGADKPGGRPSQPDEQENRIDRGRQAKEAASAGEGCGERGSAAGIADRAAKPGGFSIAVCRREGESPRGRKGQAGGKRKVDVLFGCKLSEAAGAAGIAEDGRAI